ncbi:hypothetical protein P3T27_007972 [Kitasatospora sp. MAA19]|uniref:plasmid partition protein n=1 Tax=unclassified Kitasatospora TaxID=2633591 RepID=UPI002473DA59|nr:plasmid partition protein [Kitasatospora sp. MAA19]MDH6711219.1 hypothetical protein [Kitasatospora sp. MAA19]
MLLHALHERGRAVKGFDADHSLHLRQWDAEAGGFPFEVVEAVSAKFHKEHAVPDGVVGVVDCGHSENHPDITDSVLRVADLAIVNLSPTGADYQRVTDPQAGVPLRDMIIRSSAFRPDNKPPKAVVLFNRVPHQKSRSLAAFRAKFEQDEWIVLDTFIERLDDFANATLGPVHYAAETKFGDLVTELEQRGLL